MAGTPIPGDEEYISPRLQRVAELAREAPKRAFIALAHHIDIWWLHVAYLRTRRDGAAGVDGQTAEEYAQGLGKRLRELLDALKSGTYRAPAVRRVHIPKGDGKTRAIGIPTFEDKVLQRAVAMLLEAVYERDFLDCSYGFRPGRSAHQALQALWDRLMAMGGGVVLEVDIQAFFDSLDRQQLRSILDQRVRDGVLRRVIDKWLKAGVLEEGRLSYPQAGTPQGGVISPLLANIYLHEVLDRWFEEVVKPRLEGEAFLIRYADDFVMVFARESDARRVMEVLPKRFGKYGLSVHPEKTRMVDFRRPRPQDPKGNGRSFDLLGFTHYWARSRKGRWVVKRKTAAKRFTRAVRAVEEWCKHNRHKAIVVQHAALVRKLRGHCAYYGITGNAHRLSAFRNQLTRIWQRWLNRRDQHRPMPWDRFHRLLMRYPLPPAVAIHSVLRQAARP
jgi:group II intron reverse transcriptase/maturase